jgi:hypothetical protein
MGNKVANNYSIEKFVNDTNLKNLINIKEEDIHQNLTYILKILTSDKDVFKSILVKEEEMKKKRQEGEEIKDEELISHRFCKLISCFIKHNFTPDHHNIYKTIIEIMSILCKTF